MVAIDPARPVHSDGAAMASQPAGTTPPGTTTTRLELYWIPVGAGSGTGAHVVRTSGRIYEAFNALAQRRRPQRLYHAALIAHHTDGPIIIEVAPVPDRLGQIARGAVGAGPVGARMLGRFRIFVYEIRRWRNGTIPDLVFAIASPVVLTENSDHVRDVLELVADVPTPVWGRDELRAGEMWNSNSMVSWILTRAGLAQRAGAVPAGGRAPGWDAGVVVANRQARELDLEG
jgi:hypothetical protein